MSFSVYWSNLIRSFEVCHRKFDTTNKNIICLAGNHPSIKNYHSSYPTQMNFLWYLKVQIGLHHQSSALSLSPLVAQTKKFICVLLFASVRINCSCRHHIEGDRCCIDTSFGFQYDCISLVCTKCYKYHFRWKMTYIEMFVKEYNF